MNVPEAIRWQNGCLHLLDQRALPHRAEYLAIEDVDAAVEAIQTLAVRGAPAIGIAAAYALAQSLRDVPDDRFAAICNSNAAVLKAARPTAVNLAWAIDRLVACAERTPSYEALASEAERIHAEDRQQCQAIGEHGSALLSNGARVLTHCNAGALAVSELGTATAPIYKAHTSGRTVHVYVDETRPLLQGARLTAWELDAAGVPVTLICDNMAATLMAEGSIDLVIVGTDRVARNGDVANKIGTLGVAVLAHHFGVPFYVACPASTYDPNTPAGSDIPIEQRAADEVLGDHAAQVPVHNPAFDVTPASLVTGLITDRGLILRPDESKLLAAFAP